MTYGYNKYNQCGPSTKSFFHDDLNDDLDNSYSETTITTTTKQKEKCIRILTKDMFPDLQSPAQIYAVIAGVYNTIIMFL